MREINLPNIDINEFSNAFVKDPEQEIPEYNLPNIDINEFSNAFVKPQPSVQNESQALNLQGNKQGGIGQDIKDTAGIIPTAIGGAVKGFAEYGKSTFNELMAPDIADAFNESPIDARRSLEQNSSNVSDDIDNLTGGLTKPTTTTQQIASSAGNMLAQGAASGLPITPSGAIGASTALETLKDFKPYKKPENLFEQGANALYEVAIALGGDIAGRKALKGATNLETYKTAFNFLKQAPTETVARIMGKGAVIAPEELQQAAKDFGANLPFNVELQKPLNDWLAHSFFDNIAVSKKWKEALQQPMEKVRTKFKNTLSEKTDKTGTEISQEAQQFTEQQVNRLNEANNQLYADFQNNPEVQKLRGSTDNIIKALKDLRKNQGTADITDKKGELSKILNKYKQSTPVPDELKEAVELYKNAKAPQIKQSLERAIPELPKLAEAEKYRKTDKLSNIIADMKDFGAKAKWNEPDLLGSHKKQLRGVYSDAVSDALADKPHLKQKWDTAQSFFSENIADVARNDVVKSLADGTKPAYALAQINTPHKAEALKEALVKLGPEGRAIYDELGLHKTQELLRNKGIITPDSDIAKIEKIGSLFDKSINENKLRAWLGPEKTEEFKQIASFVKILKEQGIEFKNVSRSGTKLTEALFAKDALEAMGAIVTGNIKKAATKLAMPALTKLFSRVAANPKTVARAKEIASRTQPKEKTGFVEKLIKSTPRPLLYAGLSANKS